MPTALRFDQVPVTCPVQERYHTIAPCLAGLRTPAEAAAEQSRTAVVGITRSNRIIVCLYFDNVEDRLKDPGVG
jgi:hypothetical protein